MPTKPKSPVAPEPCEICGAPSIDRPGKELVLCANCAAMAREIANQKALALVQTIRQMHAEHATEENAA